MTTITVQPLSERTGHGRQYTHRAALYDGFDRCRLYYAIEYTFGQWEVMDGAVLGNVMLFARPSDRARWIAEESGRDILSRAEPAARRTIDTAHRTDGGVRFVDAEGAWWKVRGGGWFGDPWLQLARA